MIEPDYDYLNERYIGSEYGDMRRERASLMRRMIIDNDGSVKPRIRELTLQMLEYMKAGTMSGRFSAKNPETSNYPKTRKNENS